MSDKISKIITPFKMQILTNFPYIEADFDALTNYQLLCKVVEYLNKVIGNENKLTIAFNNLYNYVSTFFENLDVQEEINTKLDEMAEDGTLADIIADYIQLKGQLVYNTVADMKSAENLYVGSFAKTYGYYNYNDNGGALYKVRNITNEDVVDEMFIIALHDDSLIAELITNDINIKQLGAYGDNTHDDSSYIKASIEKLKYANIPVGIYKCNINYTSDIEVKIIGDNAELKPYNSNYPVISFNCSSITKAKIFKNLKFDLQEAEIGLQIRLNNFVDSFYPQLIEIDNINSFCNYNFTGKVLDLAYIREINVNNIFLKRDRVSDEVRTGIGINLVSCMNLNIKNSNIGHFDTAINIENGTMSSEGILIDNVEMFFNNYGVKAISNNDHPILSLRIINCMIDQIQEDGIKVDGTTSCCIMNNWLGAYINNSNSIEVLSTYRQNFGLLINNNTFWHYSDKTDSFPILLSRSSSYNIYQTSIINNIIQDYKLNAIHITGNEPINKLLINQNQIDTSSSDSSNKFIGYTTSPNNAIISNNIVGGIPYFDDNMTFWHNTNSGNKKVLSISDITIGSTVQNNTNKYLFMVIVAHNSSETNGRIIISEGPTNATIAEKYTNKIYSGTSNGYNQTVTALIPPYCSYAINKSDVVTIDSIYGVYL